MPISSSNDPPGSSRGHVLFLIGITVGLLTAAIVDRLTFSEEDRDIEFLRAVRDLAMESYIDGTTSGELVDDALRGMIEGLDPYSHYYDAEEIAALDRETTGEFRGIGVVFRRPIQEAQILFPFPDSPAAEAGMRVGDRIVELDGASTETMEPGELQRSIQTSGEKGLRFKVVGLDGEERDLVVLARQVIDPTVRHAQILDSENGIGYLSVLSFTHRTPGEFDGAVRKLLDEGMRSLVIDLRSNPGGILEAAVAMANRFVAEGPIVETRMREENRIAGARSEDAHFRDLPIVLLVDEGSASASEVLAGALQDHGVAPLIGEPTYGKGTVQTLTRFDEDRAIIKVTTAKYFTPSGRGIEREVDSHGIAPDLLVEIPPEERDAIYQYLGSYSPPDGVRPALDKWQTETEVALLPARPEDRQLEAAIELLEGSLAELELSAAD